MTILTVIPPVRGNRMLLTIDRCPANGLELLSPFIRIVPSHLIVGISSCSADCSFSCNEDVTGTFQADDGLDRTLQLVLPKVEPEI